MDNKEILVCIKRIEQQVKNTQLVVEFQLQSTTTSSAKDWRIELPRNSNTKNIEGRIEKVLDDIKPDAIRITTWIDGKRQPLDDIKLTDTYIPNVDEAKKRGDDVFDASSMRANFQEFASQLGQQFQGALSGVANQLGQAQIAEIRQESQREIQSMQHQNELDKRDEKILHLQEKIAETEGYLKEEEKENDNLRQQAEKNGTGNSELIKTGALMLAGFVKPELVPALAGMFGGSDSVAQLSAEDNSPRGISEMEIQAYIQTLDEAVFSNFEMLVIYLKQYPQALELILKKMMDLEAQNNSSQKVA